MGFRSFIITLYLLGAGAGSAAAESCADDVLDLRGDWGQARFKVQIADSGEERGRGLMFVQSMPRNAGMLFVYDKPGPVAFWMKNTLIPLDMIFADETGTVTRVHQGAVPGDLTPIDGGEGVQYVLEVNEGIAGMFGIGPDSQLRHPAIGADAAWACDATDN